MDECPHVRMEDGLKGKLLWILQNGGGDLELHLLAIGLKRDIAVVTALENGSTYARKYPCKAKPEQNK